MISSLFFVFAFLYSVSVYLAVSFSVVISSLFFVFAFLYSLSVYLAVSFSVVISPSVSPFVVLSKNLSTAGLLSQSQLHQSPVSQHCLFPPPTTRTRGWTLRGQNRYNGGKRNANGQTGAPAPQIQEIATSQVHQPSIIDNLKNTPDNFYGEKFAITLLTGGALLLMSGFCNKYGVYRLNFRIILVISHTNARLCLIAWRMN